MTTTTDSRVPLRRALLIDAAASGTMGVLLLLAAGPLARLLGLPLTLLRGVGAFLIPFAALLVWVAGQSRPPAGYVRTIVVGNALWVVASVMLLVSDAVAPTGLGVLFVLAQAAAVAVFAYLEYVAPPGDGRRRERANAATAPSAAKR